MAGGCGIVASCDFAYATTRSRFATPEIGIGLFTLFVLPGLLRCLTRRLKADTGYNLNHYVVISGFYDSGFYVHDPLWPSDLGSSREWPETALCEALAGAAAYSINQGVIVRSEREILAPTVAEFGQVANESLSNIVLLGYLSDIYQALGIVAGNINARQGLALAEIVRLKRK